MPSPPWKALALAAVLLVWLPPIRAAEPTAAAAAQRHYAAATPAEAEPPAVGQTSAGTEDVRGTSVRGTSAGGQSAGDEGARAENVGGGLQALSTLGALALGLLGLLWVRRHTAEL